MQVALRAKLAAQSEAQEILLDRLRTLVRGDEATPCVSVRCNNGHTLSAVQMDTPMLVIPLRGRKRFRDKRRWLAIDVGEMGLIPSPMALDIENIPDPVEGWFTAVGIPLEDHVLTAARQLIRHPVADRGHSGPVCLALESHIADLTHWLDAMQRDDSSRACYSVVGVALRLYAQGHRSLLHPPAESLSGRIRKMIANVPTHDWSSGEIEGTLGVSGATLRRHLALEGVSLRHIISDARLSHGLSLLLTTRLSVKVVASRSGYGSISTFVKRFRERYGVEPSRVRGIGGV